MVQPSRPAPPRSRAVQVLAGVTLVLAVLIQLLACHSAAAGGSAAASAAAHAATSQDRDTGCPTTPTGVAAVAAAPAACRPPSTDPLPPGLLATVIAAALLVLRSRSHRTGPPTAPARAPHGRHLLLGIRLIRV